MSEFVGKFAVLSTTVNNNETKNSLAGRRIFNFLNNSLQEIYLLTPAIILMIFLWVENTFLLSVEFLQKVNPHYIMDWKYEK
jgi:hypothetical protein